MRAIALLLAVAALAGAGCGDPQARREARLARAEARESAGDAAGAARLLRGALDADPRDARVRRALAEHWMRRGAPDEARRVLDDLPEDVPRDADYLAALARASLDLAPLAEAAAALATLERAGPVDTALRDRFLQRWLETRAAPEILRPLSSSAAGTALELVLEKGDLARAAALWRAVAARTPDADRLLDRLVEATLRAEDWAPLDALEAALRARGTPEALVALHGVWLRKGAAGEAAALEADFLRRFPDHPARFPLLLARARRENRAGEHADALTLAQGASRLRPEEADALVEQAVALRALRRPAEARAVIETALLAEPRDPAAERLADALRIREAMRTDHRLEIELRQPRRRGRAAAGSEVYDSRP